MPSDAQVAAARRIHRRTGRTFYLATRFLPERVRNPTYVLYGFFRVADEVVDGEDRPDPETQRAEMERIRSAVLGDTEPDDPVLAAFREVRAEHDIPREEVDTFLDAMAADADTDRYETYGDLESYTRGSAVAVAHMMTAVMAPPDPETARPHAAALGEAFQLTNFLRDVGEDVRERDRVYLPASLLREHGVDPEQVLALDFDEGVAAAVRDLLEWTERLYRVGVSGIAHLPLDCQFPVLLAAVLYADHHRLIRKRGYDTLSATPGLSTRRKLSLLARTYWRWRRTRDPEATFDAVSSVDGAGGTHARSVPWEEGNPTP
jgi:phytoene synthase